MDAYVEVEDGTFDLPKGAVRAMNRQLDTQDKPVVNSYVALCTYKGGPCFGRASQLGPYKQLHAWFPWGDRERNSGGDVDTFKVLVDQVPDREKGFSYVWVPLCEARQNPDLTPVEAPNSDGCSPAVVTNVVTNEGEHLGEMLGKARTNPVKIKEHGQMAWTNFREKIHCHTGTQYEQCYVLCQKRLPGVERHRQPESGVSGDLKDTYVDVSDEDELPKGAVKAMNRGLDNPDQTCIDSYVALCTYNGEACFGRACLTERELHAWFPWGGKERSSIDEVKSFKILVDRGRDNSKGFRYVWTPLYKAKRGGKYTPVQVDGISPAVVTDVNVPGRHLGEVLGKTKVHGEMAWTCYDGKELVHKGTQYEECYVLCRKRL